MSIKGSTIRMRRRAFVASVVTVVMLFLILIIRLLYLQIIQGSHFFKMANLQQLASTKLVPKRGVIYDRNMVPLAQSATVWNVVLESNYIRKDEEKKKIICSELSKILDIPIEKMNESANKKSYYVNVKKKIDNNLKNAIVDFKSNNKISNGIRLIEDYKRFYPEGHLASSVLGFIGNDGQGLAGIESYYDRYKGL